MPNIIEGDFILHIIVNGNLSYADFCREALI